MPGKKLSKKYLKGKEIRKKKNRTRRKQKGGTAPTALDKICSYI